FAGQFYNNAWVILPKLYKLSGATPGVVRTDWTYLYPFGVDRMRLAHGINRPAKTDARHLRKLAKSDEWLWNAIRWWVAESRYDPDRFLHREIRWNIRAARDTEMPTHAEWLRDRGLGIEVDCSRKSALYRRLALEVAMEATADAFATFSAADSPPSARC